MTASFHEDMKVIMKFYGSTSDSFEVKSGGKQGYVLAPILLEYALLPF